MTMDRETVRELLKDEPISIVSTARSSELESALYPRSNRFVGTWKYAHCIQLNYMAALKELGILPLSTKIQLEKGNPKFDDNLRSLPVLWFSALDIVEYRVPKFQKILSKNPKSMDFVAIPKFMLQGDAGLPFEPLLPYTWNEILSTWEEATADLLRTYTATELAKTRPLSRTSFVMLKQAYELSGKLPGLASMGWVLAPETPRLYFGLDFEDSIRKMTSNIETYVYEYNIVL